ncbi:MAG: hypothetical protein KJ949_02190 [Nanoarchaeota archaeon]|nr:hypothetical protein [Nanoarchaeota archaeon]
MYKKFLIVASKQDKAGINITTELSQFRKNPVLSAFASDKPNFDFYLVDKETIFTENLDLEKINKYDFVIFASKHESESKEKTLSLHAPGNWRTADYGGTSGKICRASALFQKKMFEVLNKNEEQYHLKDYKITLEATHHGPLINKPCLFIEIGSTENQWGDRKAGFVIATTIRDTLEQFKPNPYAEIAIAIGGPHYCPNFNKIQLNSNVAIAHVIPSYAIPITKEMIQQAMDNTEEEIDFALLDWKGLGKAEQRQEVLKILDELYLDYKKTGEVGK